MLFRKKIQKSCSYCKHGTKFENDKILCPKKGIMPSDKKCRKFSYDPLKRVPLKPKAPDFEKYNKEDYSL